MGSGLACREKCCLAHSADAAAYHTTHIGQHIQLYAITGDTVFARIAEQFYTDFPPHGISGNVIFAAGVHLGYRFDAAGRIVATKRISLSRQSSAPAVNRLRVRRQTGIWYPIGAGSRTGYHVPEIRQRSYLLGTRALMAYLIPRPGRTAVAPLTAYAIDSAGRITSEVTGYRLSDEVVLSTRAVLNGGEHLRLGAGDYAGRWVSYSAIVRT